MAPILLILCPDCLTGWGAMGGLGVWPDWLPGSASTRKFQPIDLTASDDAALIAHASTELTHPWTRLKIRCSCFFGQLLHASFDTNLRFHAITHLYQLFSQLRDKTSNWINTIFTVPVTNEINIRNARKKERKREREK